MKQASEHRQLRTPPQRLYEAAVKGGKEVLLVASLSCAEGKEYDLKALVRGRSGAVNYLGTTRTEEIGMLYDGAVVLSGFDDDPTLKKLTIKWHPNIASIALSAYSLRRNGAGSFSQHGVIAHIEQRPVGRSSTIRIDTRTMTDQPRRYTLYFGEVIFEPHGQLEVMEHKVYSRPGSRDMLAYDGDEVVLDGGPEAQPARRSPRA